MKIQIQLCTLKQSPSDVNVYQITMILAHELSTKVPKKNIIMCTHEFLKTND